MIKKKKYTGQLGERDKKIVSKFLTQEFANGQVKPRDILEKARSRNSPIHHLFEWDNSIASEKYRLIQARRLITCLIVEIQGKEVREYTPPIYVGSERSFVKTERALQDKDLWAQVIDLALQDALRWKARYEKYHELKLIVIAINKTEKKLSK